MSRKSFVTGSEYINFIFFSQLQFTNVSKIKDFERNMDTLHYSINKKF